MGAQCASPPWFLDRGKIWPSSTLGQIGLNDYCKNRLSFLSLLQLIHIVKTENSKMLTSKSGFLSGLESWAIEHLLWWNWSCEKTCSVSLAIKIPFLGKLELWENLSRRNLPLGLGLRFLHSVNNLPMTTSCKLLCNIHLPLSCIFCWNWQCDESLFEKTKKAVPEWGRDIGWLLEGWHL